jgi:acyl dehydratase
MQDSFVKVGDRVTFAKTVGECDIYLFAGITGDFSVNHINEQYMAHSKFGRRIAHGALIVGYMSNSIIDRQPRSASVIPSDLRKPSARRLRCLPIDCPRC